LIGLGSQTAMAPQLRGFVEPRRRPLGGISQPTTLTAKIPLHTGRPATAHPAAIGLIRVFALNVVWTFPGR
jgi:hypothetical protein